MKYLIFFISLISLNLSVFSQCDESLTGDWKVISCFNGEIYFNLKTDSTFLTTEIKNQYPDSISQRALLQTAIDIYGSLMYHYDKNGTFILTSESHFLYSGKYCFVPSNETVLETSKDSMGKEIVEKINAKLENGLLRLSKKWDGEKMYDLVLEKLNK